jgi:formamidopyrimidine-DNA glycosylase
LLSKWLTMPELPEVETVRRGLQPVLEGRRLTKVEARRPDLRFPLPARMVERLTGARVTSLRRRAKYLLIDLDRGETLISHLGMSGRWLIAAKGQGQPGDFYYDGPALPAHDHVVIETEAGDRLIYNDPRRFGFLDLAATGALEETSHFKGMGPEPLGNAFGPDVLAAAFEGKAQSVKAALLDQRVVAGLGNIYVCEALWRAGISPKRAAGKIAAGRLPRLAEAIRDVLGEAIRAGGSTLRDFAAVDGAAGGFQQRFSVYDQAGQPCQTPGCAGTVRRIVQQARSSFYCAVCQR